MKLEFYQEVRKYLQQSPFPKFSDFRKEFSNENILVMRSIFSTERVRRTKKSFGHHACHEITTKYYDWFCAAAAKEEITETPGFVADYAELVLDLSPGIFARFLVEKFVENKTAAELDSSKHSDDQNEREFAPNRVSQLKTAVNEYMRDPKSIPDDVMGREIWICILRDEVYGPITESMKHIFGEEKELLLKEKLKAREIPFLDECQLRSQGYDKTPDVKLEIPCVLNGSKIVNWIESKALFGDPKSHEQYLKDQYMTYSNRFGQGIVIYWLGFVDSIGEKSRKDGIFVFDDLPECLASMHQFFNNKI